MSLLIPPAGTSPLSAYTPPRPGALLPAPFIMADKIDPATGDLASLLEGADPTDAQIQWQFTVRQNSGAALGVNGHRLHLIKKATDGAKVQLEDEAKRVMRPFVQRGDVKDLEITAGVVGDSTATAAVEIACTNVYTEQRARARGGL